MADMNYSLSDLAAITKGNDGAFGGSSWGWLILIFLFFLGFGNGGLFGGRAGGMVTENAATQSSVDTLASSIDVKTLLAAIQGNNDAIRNLSDVTGANFANVQSALCGVKSAVEQTAAQTNLSIAQLGSAVQAGDANIIYTLQNCCCNLKTEMLTSLNNISGQLATINQGIGLGFVQTQNAMNQRTAEIIAAGTANTQRIVDILNIHKTEELQEKLASCRLSEQSQYIISQLKNSGCNCSGTGSCC